jgi:signal transduction histidine kinase
MTSMSLRRSMPTSGDDEPNNGGLARTGLRVRSYGGSVPQPRRARGRWLRRRARALLPGSSPDPLEVHGLSVELFAHDLRSPLLASRREVLNLLHGPRAPAIPGREPADTLELLANLERSLERIDHLMVDILELASLPVVEMPRETFPARELVEAVLEQCSERSRLRWRVPTSLFVTGNRTLLVRALLNLVENALRHTAGPVLIDLNRAADGLLMLVDDHGPGVPAELRDVIFEPLARIDPESSLGAGLGLTLVRRVAEAHGGLAGVEQAPTGGARFVLWVPQASVIRRRGSVVSLVVAGGSRRT